MNTPTTTEVEPLKVIADIIKTEMGLTKTQISTAYQNYSIPKEGIFVVVGYFGPTESIASQAYFDSSSNSEVQELSCKHTIQIDVMSIAPDNSARIRKEEIALALQSFYSKRQQDENFLGIAWLQSDFIDASAKEENGVMLNRYVTTCAVNALHRKVKSAQYLSTFEIELATDSQDGRETTAEINPATPVGE